jgi:cell shape-determining protein MreC
LNTNALNWKKRLTAPAGLLAVALAAAGGLMLLSERHAEAVKGIVAEALRPGQRGMLRVRSWADWGVRRVTAQLDLDAELAESERRREWLEEENRRLSVELMAERSRLSGEPTRPGDGAERPLLSARCVEARVLGHQAQAFLSDRRILDVGSRDGVRRDALVIDSPASLIDLGRIAGVEPDQLVLSQGRVWGKIVHVGPQTSTVLTIAEAGYRGMVRLADPGSGNGPPRLGPQGILEGTGEPLARIRLVEVTEPVSVGDAVYATDGGGILPEPPLCGHVVRVEQPVGAAHWEIWMEPAVGSVEPQHVAVVRPELNPTRIAEKPETETRH